MKSGKARNLPVFECLIPVEWEDLMKINVLVSRKHTTGNVTVGCFLVDLFCTGVKDAFYLVNIPEYEYQDLKQKYAAPDVEIMNVSYELAHNIIYAGLEFAQEYGIAPYPDFTMARYILEEDDKVPLIDIPVGENDMPLLILTESDPKNSYYLKQLRAFAGVDGYTAVDEQGDYVEGKSGEVSWAAEEWSAFISACAEEDFESALSSTDDYGSLFDRLIEVYDKCIFKVEMAGKQLGAVDRTTVKSFSLTYNPINTDNYTDEEVEEQSRIYSMLTSEHLTTKELKRLAIEIEDKLKIWPNNKVLWNYLNNVYAQLQDEKKMKEVIEHMAGSFPDYIFGRVHKANLLLDEGHHEQVPKVFDNLYSLADLYPNRNEFHVSEFVVFNTVMCRYFMTKDDLLQAWLYYKMIDDIEVPDHMPLAEGIFSDLYLKVSVEAFTHIETIKDDQAAINEMIALLVDEEQG
ncbi:MAG: hypothetical protein AAGC88_14275 [Bacteroidota bacterium]